jgi:hypothetical protein
MSEDSGSGFLATATWKNDFTHLEEGAFKASKGIVTNLVILSETCCSTIRDNSSNVNYVEEVSHKILIQ